MLLSFAGAFAKLVLTTMSCMCITTCLQGVPVDKMLCNEPVTWGKKTWSRRVLPWPAGNRCCSLSTCKAVMQISAAFSGGSAIAVLGGGILFCRYTGAGRRNFITGLTILASACFFVLTRYPSAADAHQTCKMSRCMLERDELLHASVARQMQQA